MRLADRVCCDFFVVVVPQVFHAMHSLLTHPLGIYAVVFDIRKLMNPTTREQVCHTQCHIVVVECSYASVLKLAPSLYGLCSNIYRCKSL